MRREYELSLWRDYQETVDGEVLIKEEKTHILSSNDMDERIRAKNIILKPDYTGLSTLTFSIPATYYDFKLEKDIDNELAKIVVNKSKLKLKIKRKWFNQLTLDYEEYKWYDFVVENKVEKHNRKQLSYEYTCTDLFIKELSKTGYDLVFDEETGVGTAHELSERILENSEWQYVKTETFTETQEVYDPITGTTSIIPVEVAQVEYLKGLKRYANSYTYVPKNKTNVDALISQLTGEGLIQNEDFIYTVTYDDSWNTTSFSLFYRIDVNNNQKTHINGYEATNIVTSFSEDSIITPYKEFEGVSGWEVINPINGSIEFGYSGTAAAETLVSYLDFKSSSTQPASFYNYGGSPYLSLGENYVLDIKYETSTIFDGFAIYEGNPNTGGVLILDVAPIGGLISTDKYWIQVPKRVSDPYFLFNVGIDKTVRVSKISLYKLEGVTEEANNAIKTYIGTQGHYGLISVLNSGINYPTKASDFELYGSYYLHSDIIIQNNYKDSIIVFIIETYKNGEYIEIYVSPESTEVDLISSTTTDKRRTLIEEKSNKFNLLQSVSELFEVWLMPVITREEDGSISREISDNRLLKELTFTSKLGWNEFAGFNYGVNLSSVSREIKGENIVTKMYVEPLENEYSETGTISISQYAGGAPGSAEDDGYNLMEDFIYNFSYYLNQGLINLTKFSSDYNEMREAVYSSNRQLLILNDSYIANYSKKSTLDNSIYTYEKMRSARKIEGEEYLSTLKWGNTVYSTIGFLDLNEANSAAYIDACIESSGMSKEDVTNYFTIIFSTLNSYYNYTLRIAEYSFALYGNGDAITPQEDSIVYKVNTLKSNINTLTSYKKNTLDYFESKYSKYITEGSWAAEQDYIENKTYYLDALKVLSTSCMPEVNYTIEAIDLGKINSLTGIEEDSLYGQDFIYNVGDKTYISDTELFGFNPNTKAPYEIEAMISSLDIYVDTDTSDKITLQVFETRFEKLFSRISAAVISLNLNEDIYGRAENFTNTGEIASSVLQASFENNRDLVMYASNQDIIIDQYGITAKDKTTPTNLVRIIDKGIFLSKDNGSTWTTGVTADGINANIINVGELNTSKITIRNSDTPSYIWNNLGITAYNPNLAGAEYEESIVRFDQHGLYFTTLGTLFGKGATGNGWWKDTLYDNEGEIIPSDGTIAGDLAKGVSYIKNKSVVSITWDGFMYNSDPTNLTNYIKIGNLGDIYGNGILMYNSSLANTGYNGTNISVLINDDGEAYFSGEIRAKSGFLENVTVGGSTNGIITVKNSSDIDIVRIDQNGIVLNSSGNSLITGSGVIGSLTTVTNNGTLLELGYNVSSMTEGLSLADIYVGVQIPENFSIQYANLILNSNAMWWTNAIDNVSFWGYSRKIKIYKASAGCSTARAAWWPGGYSDTVIGTWTQVVSGDFVIGGVNGGTTYTGITLETENIASLLSPGYNAFRISCDIPLTESNIDTIMQKTGTGVAILNIKGFDSLS